VQRLSSNPQVELTAKQRGRSAWFPSCSACRRQLTCNVGRLDIKTERR